MQLRDRYAMSQRAGVAGAGRARSRDVSAWLDERARDSEDFRLDSCGLLEILEHGQGAARTSSRRKARSPNEVAGERRDPSARSASYASFSWQLTSSSFTTGSPTDRSSSFSVSSNSCSRPPGCCPGSRPMTRPWQRRTRFRSGRRKASRSTTGILLSHVLTHPGDRPASLPRDAAPRAETQRPARTLRADGSIDLGTACVSRMGKASIVETA